MGEKSPLFLGIQKMNPLSTVKIKDGDSYRIINESDFKHGVHELCDDEKLSMVITPLVVNAKVGITPELQKIIDDAKAECEKALTENESLETQLKSAVEDLETERAVRITFMSDVDAMQARIDELKSAAASPDLSVEQPIEVAKEIELPKSTENDFASWTIPQIKDYLAAKEIGFKASASKDELLALIPKE